MKFRWLGLGLVMVSLASAVSIFAFSTATVNSAASLTITATDQLLAINANGTTDNPSGMVSRVATGAGTGKVTIDFGSNGTSSKGLQADSTYTYDNIIRVKNNNGGAKSIDVTAGTVSGLTVLLGISAWDGTNCGTVTYSANPAAVSTAGGGEVCVSFSIQTAANIADGGLNIPITVTAN